MKYIKNYYYKEPQTSSDKWFEQQKNFNATLFI